MLGRLRALSLALIYHGCRLAMPWLPAALLIGLVYRGIANDDPIALALTLAFAALAAFDAPRRDP